MQQVVSGSQESTVVVQWYPGPGTFAMSEKKHQLHDVLSFGWLRLSNTGA